VDMTFVLSKSYVLVMVIVMLEILRIKVPLSSVVGTVDYIYITFYIYIALNYIYIIYIYTLHYIYIHCITLYIHYITLYIHYITLYIDYITLYIHYIILHVILHCPILHHVVLQ
jgi:hypothetical protein